MVQVTGNNLCERQHDLNRKVNEAAKSKVEFDDIKNEKEISDIDRLFKIDLAAKYKSIDYIVETLKCGDSFYVSRSLKKCPWLYDDEYSNVTNTEYLHLNIFPFMSTRMIKKFLTAVSMHLKDDNRAEDFYKYCRQEKLTNITDKFLIKCSKEVKLNYIMNNVVNNDVKYLKNLIGNSFDLFEAYLLKISDWNKRAIFNEFTHLFTISAYQYLDLLEKHVQIETRTRDRLGLRISKDIMCKHKDRVIKNPKLYIHLLSVSKIVRHSNKEEAKLYLVDIIPSNADEFWSCEFKSKYKSIIDIIPTNECYVFIKTLFCNKYPSQEFEMSRNFYDQGYYKLMSCAELDTWATQHISSGRELLGAGLDYMWYKFVNFETAFIEIKKIINITKDQLKRRDMLNILIECAKNQNELEKVLKYYYERHVNESKKNKEYFMKKVMCHHNVFELEESCWCAFNNLLSSLQVYDTTNRGGDPEFKVVSILYHILNAKELPEILINYLEKDMSSYCFRPYVMERSDKKKQIIYSYVFNFYLKRIEAFDSSVQDAAELEEAKSKVATFIHFILEFMAMFKKKKDDIPETIMKFIKLDWKTYRYQQILETEAAERVNEERLLKMLKKEANLVIDQIPNIKSALVSFSYHMKIPKLLHKLKVYFPDDVRPAYLHLFYELLVEKDFYHNVAAFAVFGIFQLENENKKVDFMKKYSPQNPKINHEARNDVCLKIQESICRFACFSRPPVPLEEMLKFIKGDYVQFSLPIFNRFLTHLPHPLCLKFVQSIIDAPISIQKHGLRLAFKCFNTHDLSKLILDSWKRTKNVSLRCIIYKKFFEKTLQENSRELFEILKDLTLDIHEDDDDEIFNVLTCNQLSRIYLGEYLEVIWKTVAKFSDKDSNKQRKSNVLSCMDKNISLMKKGALKPIVDECVQDWLKKTECEVYDADIVTTAKWEFLAHYIVYFTSTEIERQENVELTNLIIKTLVQRWNLVHNQTYVNRRFCVIFVKQLVDKCLNKNDHDYDNPNPIFEAIIEGLKSALPFHEIYMVIWDLRIGLINRKLIAHFIKKAGNHNEIENNYKVAVDFGKEISSLIKEAVDSKHYCSYYLNEMKQVISKYATAIDRCLSNESQNNEEQILVAIAKGLLELDMSETRILALQLLPECLEEYKSDNNLNDLRDVIKKIKENADIEILCFIQNKYYHDCKRRRFI